MKMDRNSSQYAKGHPWIFLAIWLGMQAVSALVMATWSTKNFYLRNWMYSAGVLCDHDAILASWPGNHCCYASA